MAAGTLSAVLVAIIKAKKRVPLLLITILLLSPSGNLVSSAPTKAVGQHRQSRDLRIVPLYPIQVTFQRREGVHIQGALSQFRSLQWALPALGIEDGLTATPGIGIADTGINLVNTLADNVREGYDFFDDSPDYQDTFGHGTEVAGIVASDVGALSSANLYALKISNADGNMDLASFKRCIPWAAARAVKIIVCSWGMNGETPALLQEAIDLAQSNGILLVAAMGNSATNQDTTADIWDVGNLNVVRVAATNREGTRASFSDYSHQWADFAAPGAGILLADSTSTEFRYGIGTSVAAPWVAAEAAMLLDALPKLPGELYAPLLEVVGRINDSVGRSESLEPLIFSGGQIHFGRALTGLLNSPMDTLHIQNIKLKKQKKLSIALQSMPAEGASHIQPVIRVQDNDVLLGFAERDDAGVYNFFVKHKLRAGDEIRILSSAGGRFQWTNPQEQMQGASRKLYDGRRWTWGISGITGAIARSRMATAPPP